MNRSWLTVAVTCVAVAAYVGVGCSKKAPPKEEKPAQATARSAPAEAAPEERTMPAAPAASAPAVTAAPAAPAKEAPATASAPATAAPVPEVEPASPQAISMHEQHGIWVTEVAVHGKAVDVTFLVTDPEKTEQILSPACQRSLIDLKTGTTIPAPTAARSRRLRIVGSVVAGVRSFAASFDNSSGLIKPGDRVSVIMDDFEVDNLPVR